MVPTTQVAAGNATLRKADFSDPRPVPPRPMQWRRAAAAFRALARQEGDPLVATYAVVDAMGGMCEERLFQKLLSAPSGRQLLADRPDLPSILADHDRLGSMPLGSLGRTYADLCRAAGIKSADVVDSLRQTSRDYQQLDAERQWFIDRLTVLHDLWHILTGYATQPRGEAALVAFSFAQGLRYRPIPVFMALSVITRVARIRDLRQAYRRGRQTATLILQRYEELLPQPLAAVRAQLKIPGGRGAHGQQPDRTLLA